MMKYEFEAIAGYEVSNEDYDNIIEPMYMATNLTKTEFVKTINKKRFALRSTKSIVKEMKQIAEELKGTCTMYTNYEAAERLDDLCKQYINRKGWKGIASYMINDTMKQSCYYPTSVTIFISALNEYKEVINLVA